MDRFSQILYDLGKEIQFELFVDANGVCELNYKDQLSIQLQYFEPKEQLLIATFLCEVPPGKFREKLFLQALIHNDEFPRVGTLAFSERNNQLTFFEFLPAVELSGEKLFEFLNQFVENALPWKEAVEFGKPLPTAGRPNQGDNGLFGLKP